MYSNLPDDEIAEYRRIVSSLASSGNGKIIFNKSADQAETIILELFRRATKEVLILTEGLNVEVFGSPKVINEALSFLRNHPQGKIKIISEMPLDKKHPLLNCLDTPEFDNRLSVRTVLSSPENKTNANFHFVVSDGSSYRIEKGNRLNFSISQFGNQEQGTALKGMFDSLFDAQTK
jgi:hypothetical protein